MAAEECPYGSSDEEAEDEELSDGLTVPGRLWKRMFEHQRTCVEWLWELHRQQAGGIVGDEMGLGKTLQVIAMWAALQKSGRGGASLVVCPATVLRQWQRETKRWAPELKAVEVLHSSAMASDPAARLALITKVFAAAEAGAETGAAADGELSGGGCSVLVTSYEMVRKCAQLLLGRRWLYVVLDEGHKIRNADAEITQLCKRFLTPHRLILTGSPIQNRLTELWSLFDFVFPGKLGTLPTFQEQFGIPIAAGTYANASRFKVQAAYQCSLVLRSLIRPHLLRRTKADVQLRLPDKSEQVLLCALSAEQRDAYENFCRSDLVERVLAGKCNAFVALTSLQKICNHPHLHMWDADDGGRARYGAWQASGKLHVVRQVLQMWKARDDRCLVFCQTRQMLDIVQRLVVSEGYSFRRLDGTTPVGQRLTLIDEYNGDGTIFAFLLTTRAGGLGINLTGANRVLLVDPDWNPANDAQARERAWRVGQSRAVAVYRLVTAGTLEEKIYQRQVFKQYLSNRVLRDPKQSRRVFRPSELRELLAPPAGGSASSETVDLFADAERRPRPQPPALPAPAADAEEGEVEGGGEEAEEGEVVCLSGPAPAAAASAAASSSMVVLSSSAAADGAADADGGSEARREQTAMLDALLAGDNALGAAGALDHEAVLAADGHRSDDVATTEARRVAERAAAAIRDDAARRGPINVPTWTGRSGTAGGPPRFGGTLSSRLLGAKAGRRRRRRRRRRWRWRRRW